MKKPDDVLTDGATPVGNLKPLVEKCRELYKLQEKAKKIAEEARKIVDQIHNMESNVIPSMMEECGVTSLDLAAGVKVEIKPIINCSLPSSSAAEKAKTAEERSELERRRAAGFAWLRKIKGGEALIKNEVIVRLGKDSEAQRKILKKVFKENGVKDWIEEVNVHPQTLNAFVRERFESGATLPPEDVFKTYTGSKAVINISKGKTDKTAKCGA